MNKKIFNIVRSKNVLSRLALIALITVAGCGKKSEESDQSRTPEKLSVCVVNYPLYYFAETIGGDKVEVSFSAPEDIDPAFWTPESQAVTEFQNADLILLNGADYAKWINKVSLPSAGRVDTSQSFKDRFIKIKGETAHIHGPEGKHEHGSLAFTTWMDLTLAAKQAAAVKEALINAQPESRSEFSNRFAELEKVLLGFDQQIRTITAGEVKPHLVYSHPVYQYFERRYEVQGLSVHWEPGEAPTAAMWKTFETQLKSYPANWMVWEGEPLAETVKKLKEMGIDSIVFTPCGNRPEAGDFVGVMEQNIRNLKRVFSHLK